MNDPEVKVIPASEIVLARVLHEDEQLMTLEVIKDEHKKLQLVDGDQFYAMVFTSGKPWA